MKALLKEYKNVDRDAVAAVLSVVPGLGHLYKHHYAQGIGLLVGNLFMVFVAGLLVLGTFGLSLILVPALWFGGVGYSAYLASDEHGHHPWLHVWKMHWREWTQRNGAH